MSLLDDVVDSLAGGAPAPRTDPSPVIEHSEPVITTTTAPAAHVPTNGVYLRFAVEVVDAAGNTARANHSMNVPPGTMKMMEMFGDGADVLEQIAKSTILEVKKSITPQPGSRGGGAILEQAVAKPGPVGGRGGEAKPDPLAAMLGLDLIERADALDRGNPMAQGPASVPRQPPPMGGPHTTGPRPGSGHPRR